MAEFVTKVDLKWRLDFANNYQFDSKGNCYNLKTMKQIKRTLIRYTEGYCIKGKFYSLTKLREHLEVIPKKEILPF